MNTNNTIEVTNLYKYYDGIPAVAGIDFSVRKGEIFGIVGPNGAGKTTLLKMLCGLIPQSSGEIRVLGYDFATKPIEIKKKIGFLPEDTPLYENMEVMDYLIFFAELFGVKKDIAIKRSEDILSALDLAPARKKIGNLSKGMKRKVAIARSLINDPEILIYDEPTSGLDPMTSKYITDFLHGLKEQGKTIVFSAHNLYQVELLCDRVLIMEKGKRIVEGSIKQIIAEYGSVEYYVEFEIADVDSLHLHFDFENLKLRTYRDHYQIETADIGAVNHVTRRIIESGGNIIEIRTEETSLEEIFLRLVK